MNASVPRRRAVARLLVLAAVVAGAFAAVAFAGVDVDDARGWVEHSGSVGPVIFVVIGALLGVALFPGHVTAALAGMLFGTLAGTALALSAALIGAVLCFGVARALGAEAVLSLLGPRGRRWRDWVAENGFGSVLASRLAPGVPSGIVNYVAGLAGIRLRSFAAAVALGALPKTIAYVSLGGALSDPVSAKGAVAIGLYTATALAGALVARKLIRARPVLV